MGNWEAYVFDFIGTRREPGRRLFFSSPSIIMLIIIYVFSATENHPALFWQFAKIIRGIGAEM